MASSPRRIWITGATRGLGLASAEAFIRQGHTVAGVGRSADAVAELRARHGSPHDFQTLDVVDDRAVAAWARRLLDDQGPPDLLINNAGQINAPNRLWKIHAEEFDKIIDVNIKGIANVLRHVVPAMIDRGSGVIVNLSSGWGRTTAADVAPYCASKWAVEGLTRALAQELPNGLAAVPLDPGIIDTDMLRICFGDRAAGFPDADAWAELAVPFLLDLGPKDNGKPLTVPNR